MRDEDNKRAPAEPPRIPVGQPHEVSRWARLFRVEPQELLLAIEAVGTRADLVRQYLADRHSDQPTAPAVFRDAPER